MKNTCHATDWAEIAESYGAIFYENEILRQEIQV